jgi:hypothetical protein
VSVSSTPLLESALLAATERFKVYVSLSWLQASHLGGVFALAPLPFTYTNAEFYPNSPHAHPSGVEAKA